MRMDSHILIIGGGFAGARVAQDLIKSKFTNVTLVDRKDYFEVTYANLRTLVDIGMGERSRMRYADFIQGNFRQGDIAHLAERHATLADGTEISFDVAVVATGSSYKAFQIAKSQDAVTLGERATQMAEEHERLKSSDNVLIIGGGPVGVELAGEIAYQFPTKSIFLSNAGNRLLQDLKPKASDLAEKQLASLGVKILNNTRLTRDDPVWENADVIYSCIGLSPNTSLMNQNFSNSLDKSGRIKVDGLLRVEGSNHVYAIGDCASTPSVKLGYVADVQGALLAKNFSALAKGKKTKSFKPQPLMSLVPVGRDKGLVQLPFAITTFRPLVNMKQKDMFIARQYGNIGVDR